jgi:hypothetical protein
MNDLKNGDRVEILYMGRKIKGRIVAIKYTIFVVLDKKSGIFNFDDKEIIRKIED